jgi:hypothetical protein
MSYTDDEELKIGDLQDDDDLDLDAGIDGPLDDDLIPEEDDEELEGFADLDGSSY